MLSEEVFIKGMIMLGAAFPDYQATEQTFEVYREMLKERAIPQPPGPDQARLSQCRSALLLLAYYPPPCGIAPGGSL